MLCTVRGKSSFCCFDTGAVYCDNGLQVSENELRPGDLIFHARDDNADEFMSIGHVAIYVGNGMQVDARGTAYGVVYRPLVPSNIGLYGKTMPIADAYCRTEMREYAGRRLTGLPS